MWAGLLRVLLEWRVSGRRVSGIRLSGEEGCRGVERSVGTNHDIAEGSGNASLKVLMGTAFRFEVINKRKGHVEECLGR